MWVKHHKTWSCEPQTFIVLKREIKYLIVINVDYTKITLLIFSKTKTVSDLNYFKAINAVLSVHEDGSNSRPSAAHRTFPAWKMDLH